MLDLSKEKVRNKRTTQWVPKLTFRKRCDERYPLCTYCELRSKPCEWPAIVNEQHNSKQALGKAKIIKPEVNWPVLSRKKAALADRRRIRTVTVNTIVRELSNGTKDNAGANIDSELTNLGIRRIAEGDQTGDVGDVGLVPMDLGIILAGMSVGEILDSSQVNMDVNMDGEIAGATNGSSSSSQSSSLQILTTQCDDFLPISLDLISPFGDFGYPFRLLPGFLFTSNLDSEGTLYLEYYREKYCSFVSIAPMTLNYFLKTFFSLATRKKSILYALTAWGGFYLELKKPEPDYSKPWLYMQKAAKLMCDEIGSVLMPSSDDEFFTLFALYLIFIGIEVCTGDVDKWFQFHQRCFQLLRSGGGPAQVAQRFGYSNDIKFLLSDFQYHDLLLSDALTSGTHFSLSEYDRVLCDGDKDYGIDPLQGTIAPIYNIMGQIANAKVEVQKLVEAMEQLETQGQEAYEERTKYYDRLVGLWSDLDRKIDHCSPWKSHMLMLARDQNQLSLHMALFELYTYICRIQLNASILSLAPSATIQQRWLLKALVLVDMLVDSPLNVSLLLALVVCGVTCWRTYDRERMRERFLIHQNLYLLGNLKRVQEIVEEIWVANPTGDVCIDWPDFAKKHGWSLWVG